MRFYALALLVCHKKRENKSENNASSTLSVNLHGITESKLNCQLLLLRGITSVTLLH